MTKFTLFIASILFFLVGIFLLIVADSCGGYVAVATFLAGIFFSVLGVCAICESMPYL